MRPGSALALTIAAATLCVVIAISTAVPRREAAPHLRLERPAVGETGDYPWPAIACGSPCVIENDAGGVIDAYTAQGRLYAATGVRVVVDGPCLSACTMLVDLDRANVCLTHRALLGYHQGRRTDPDGTLVLEDLRYETPGLEAYIKSRGGEPDPMKGHLLMLNWVEASKFYKVCPGPV
jgi:hypothetical protein